MGSAGQWQLSIRVHGRSEQAAASSEQLPLRTVALAAESEAGFVNCCSDPGSVASGQRQTGQLNGGRLDHRAFAARGWRPRCNVPRGRPLSGTSGRCNRSPSRFRTVGAHVTAEFTASSGAECGLPDIPMACYHCPEVFACQFDYGPGTAVFNETSR